MTCASIRDRDVETPDTGALVNAGWRRPVSCHVLFGRASDVPSLCSLFGDLLAAGHIPHRNRRWTVVRRARCVGVPGCTGAREWVRGWD